MSALRITGYPPNRYGTPDSFEPFTIVVVEEDLAVSIEDAAMDQFDLGDPLGVFVVVETFDSPGEGIEAATVEAIRRHAAREADERLMACLYHYEAMAFSIGTEDAVLFGTIPSPLSADDTAYALRRLAHHPGYRKQTVLMPCEEGRKLVRLSAGEVTIEEVGP